MFQIQRLAASTLLLIALGATPAHAQEPVPTPAPTPSFQVGPEARPVVSATASGPASGGSIATITVAGATGPLPIWFGSARATVLTEKPGISEGEPFSRYEVLVPAGEEGKVDVSIGTPANEPTATTDDDFTYIASPGAERLTPTEPQCGDVFEFDVNGAVSQTPPPIVVGNRAFKTTPVDDDTLSFLAPSPSFLPGTKYRVTRSYGGNTIGYLQDGCFSRTDPGLKTTRHAGIRWVSVDGYYGPGTTRPNDPVYAHTDGIDVAAKLWFGPFAGSSNVATSYWPDPSIAIRSSPSLRREPDGAFAGPEGDVEVSVRTDDGKTTYGQTSAANDIHVVSPQPRVLVISPASGPVEGGTRIRIAVTERTFPTKPAVFIDGRPATNVSVITRGADPYDASWSRPIISATVPAGVQPGPVEVRIPSPWSFGSESIPHAILGRYDYTGSAPPTPTPTPATSCDRAPKPDEALRDFSAPVRGSLLMPTVVGSSGQILSGTASLSHCFDNGTFASTLAFDPLSVRLTTKIPGAQVLATMTITPTSSVTGTIDRDGNARTTFKVRFKFPSVTMLGVQLAAGSNCQTKLATSVTLTGSGDLGLSIAGLFSVSNLSGCTFLNGLVPTDVSGDKNAMNLSILPMT